MNEVTLTNSNQIPRETAQPLYSETPEQAAARLAARWGCAVTVYRLGRMIFIAREANDGKANG